ncbi:SpaA isopeptide-forming pilin-related protein [Leucobacter sp. USCH14]|uniref:SpaA isopeptide-forming pilin-related protein n=1 Tax=Leucobacter sp. USCH14 TaxID=3024838 RepID=UPI0030ABD950
MRRCSTVLLAVLVCAAGSQIAPRAAVATENHVSNEPALEAPGDEEAPDDLGTSAPEDPAEEPEPTTDEGDPTAHPETSEEAPESPGQTSTSPSETAAPDPVATGPPVLANDISAQAALACVAGTYYSVSSTGQLRSVSGQTVRTVGTSASGVSSFNGLGVGAGGEQVYAYERTNTGRTVTMWEFNTTTNTWSNTGDTYNTGVAANGGFTGQLIAGAVNQSTGNFNFGGYQTATVNGVSTLQFKIWRYSPASGTFAYLGYINAGTNPGTGSNGDLDFDASGNMFILRGAGNTGTLFSVTAANLQAAGGGLIPSSASNNFASQANVNGIAFDASGRLFMGSTTTVEAYNMPGFTNRQVVNSTLTDSTDLASCSSPPTVTVEKRVNARAKAEDQFTLNLSNGATSVGSATTSGESTGLQAQRVGPVPTGRGATLTFTETAAGQTRLSDYTTTYECRVDGSTTPLVSGTGTSGTLTVPTTGQSIVCTFTNSTRPATVRVNKTWIVDGQQFAQGSQPAGMTATLGLTPLGSTTGAPQWGQLRSGYAIGQNVAISEEVSFDPAVVPGCRLTSATISGSGITGTPALGSPTSVVLPAAANEYTVTNTVTCEQTLTLVKQVTNGFGGALAPAAWSGRLHAQQSGSPRLDFATGQSRVVATGSYVISERQLDGYELTGIACQGATFSPATSTLTIARGQQATCTLTNRDLPGDATWSKVGPDGDALAGSRWTLTGPAGSTPLVIDDCTAASAAACTGRDANPGAGDFRLTGLSWGEYTLTETTAPAGFVRDPTVHRFTISASQRTASLGALTNQQADGPALPLTGGTGSDAFTIIGSSVLGVGIIAAVVFGLRRRAVSQAPRPTP